MANQNGCLDACVKRMRKFFTSEVEIKSYSCITKSWLLQVSSNINEGIKTDFLKHKNAHKRTKTKKAVLNVLKKYQRERKSPIRLFGSLCFLCAFYAFLCVKQ